MGKTLIVQKSLKTQARSKAKLFRTFMRKSSSHRRFKQMWNRLDLGRFRCRLKKGRTFLLRATSYNPDLQEQLTERMEKDPATQQLFCYLNTDREESSDDPDAMADEVCFDQFDVVPEVQITDYKPSKNPIMLKPEGKREIPYGESELPPEDDPKQEMKKSLAEGGMKRRNGEAYDSDCEILEDCLNVDKNEVIEPVYLPEPEP